MKSLVVFDSAFGNTKRIAEIIAQSLGAGARTILAKDFKESDLSGVGLLVAGSPINAWRPSENMGKFLSSLTKGQLKGIKAAAFDTRVKMFISGDAAKKISKALREKGAEIIAEPKGFFVKGKEGPLFDGELEKAAEWAKQIKSKFEGFKSG